MQHQYRTQSNGFFFFHIVVKDGLNSPQCRSAASFPAGHAMPRLHRASPAPHPAGWRRKLFFLLSGSRRPADPPEAQGRSVMPSAGARPVRRIGIKSRGRLSGLNRVKTSGASDTTEHPRGWTGKYPRLRSRICRSSAAAAPCRSAQALFCPEFWLPESHGT